jgi:hypothetical protein
MVRRELVRAVTGSVAYQTGPGVRAAFFMRGDRWPQGGSVSPAAPAPTGSRYKKQETETETEGKDWFQVTCLTFRIVATRPGTVKKGEPRGLLSALRSFSFEEC